MKSIEKLFIKLTKPCSLGVDEARHEFIINTLLVGSIVSSFLAFTAGILVYMTRSQSQNLLNSWITSLTFLTLTIIFLILSKKGRAKLVSLVFIFLCYMVSTYAVYIWGINLPAALLTYALVIVMSGILIESSFAIKMTVLVGATLGIIAFLQTEKFIPIDKSWQSMPNPIDALQFAAAYLIIAIVFWLSNSEVEKSLKRARTSEESLRKQNEKLEEIIEERTREIRKIQMDKLKQLYRFAKLGRLTSGIIHDLVSPLNAITLNLEMISKVKKKDNKLPDLKTLIERANNGAKSMESYIYAVRKQMQYQHVEKTYDINHEITDAIKLLSSKASAAEVKISFSHKTSINYYGNPIKFNQLITNLLSNAIDAYEGVERKDKRIEIKSFIKDNNIIVSIRDNGRGIQSEYLKKVFDPFFTTKNIEKGTGLGLSLCQETVEKELLGKIGVDSKEKEGTVFTVEFPRKKNFRE